MKAKEVYLKYMIPQNLQIHMLRVSALAYLLLGEWNTHTINRTTVLQTCLLHDIAKPITFDLKAQSAYDMSKAEIENIKLLQTYLKTLHAKTEHQAALSICREIRVDLLTYNAIDNFEWHNLPVLLKSSNVELLLAIYCDMRISPKGIMSLSDRISDLSKRCPDKDLSDIKMHSELLESFIKANVRFNLNNISTNELEALFPTLLNIELSTADTKDKPKH